MNKQFDNELEAIGELNFNVGFCVAALLNTGFWVAFIMWIY